MIDCIPEKWKIIIKINYENSANLSLAAII